MRVLLLGEIEEVDRHVIGQPHAVLRDVERVPGVDHLGRTHDEDHVAAATTADLLRGLEIGREMDVMTLALDQALGADRVDKPIDRAVIEDRRWRRGRERELDLDRVALIGADARAVFGQREPLLVAGRDDLIELGARERRAVRGRGGEQRGHVGPACAIERNADALWFVTEN